jgi:uncharacterized protein YjbI with pentapeptide repeats
MADPNHIAELRKGVTAWNAWRDENRNIHPDLSNLHWWADLRGANFEGADLSEANLRGAYLRGRNLSGANLGGADLSEADLIGANLVRANLRGADLNRALLGTANLSGADLSGANLSEADLINANLSGADLSGAYLGWANLVGTRLNSTDLKEANLQFAILVGADFTHADLTGCLIHGVSAWRLNLEGANLVITLGGEPEITVDNIEVAQFVYLLLHNQKIRDVIDTITSKAVLILGRFTDERKAVLDALREELRKRDYLPILFDFEVPERRNITETVTLLARMARFIIADLTDPSSIPQELQAIIPSVRVPVQPLLLEGSSLYSMFKDFDPQDFHWVLPVYRYKEPKQLLATLAEKVIAPAEGKVKALEERRRMIEAELTKPQ